MILRIDLLALIPAYNEEAIIEETLQSLLHAGMEPKKIIVINDASTDKTAEIARSLGVEVIDNEVNLGKAGGVTKALNIINHSPRYKDLTHVCFLDADTLVDRRYFFEVRKRLREDALECEKEAKKNKQKKPISVLCGKAKSIPHNWLTAFRAYEYWITHALHKPAQATLKAITVAPGCASTYSVEALKETVWDGDTVTEDMDVTIQVALSGGRVVYEEKAIVYTQDPRTLRDYFNQIGKRWYKGTWQVAGKHGLLWRGPFRMLNWECRIMMLEPFLYIGVPVFYAIHRPETIFWFFLMCYLTNVVLAVIASWHENRFDILKYSLIFSIMWVPNTFLFIWASWNIIGRKNSVQRWYSPKRYNITKGEV